MIWEFSYWLLLAIVRVAVGLVVGVYVLVVPWKYVKVPPKIRCFIWVHNYEAIYYESQDEDDIDEYTHHKCKDCCAIKYDPPGYDY